MASLRDMQQAEVLRDALDKWLADDTAPLNEDETLRLMGRVFDFLARLDRRVLGKVGRHATFKETARGRRRAANRRLETHG